MRFLPAANKGNFQIHSQQRVRISCTAMPPSHPIIKSGVVLMQRNQLDNPTTAYKHTRTKKHTVTTWAHACILKFIFIYVYYTELVMLNFFMHNMYGFFLMFSCIMMTTRVVFEVLYNLWNSAIGRVTQQNRKFSDSFNGRHFSLLVFRTVQ